MMRINKFLSRSGIASRRNAEKLILNGEITINNAVVTDLSYQVSSEDVVVYKNKVIKPVKQIYYIMLNKPIGYLCTNSKKFDDKIIFDLIDIDEKLFSIGRLDKDSRGLILITNDGDLYNKVIHPRSEIYKKYIVRINNILRNEDKIKLENGVDIGNYITNKSRVKILDKRLIQIEINEGKNRQIRKMFAVLGYEVLDLNRISIGEVVMTDIEIGKYRNLNKKELDYLNSL